MKISNETKVGALTAIAITLLILGFNFLKGKSLFDKSTQIYAVFPTVEGLTASNPVTINGLQVGTVAKLVEKDKDLTGVIVVVNLTKDIHIPKNSVASVNSSLLGTANLDIKMGSEKVWLENGDTMLSAVSLGMLDKFSNQLSPVIGKLDVGLKSLDSVVQVIGETFDPATKNNLRATIANFAASSNELKVMLNSKTGPLAHTLQNVDTLSTTLKDNRQDLEKTLTNFRKLSDKLAEAKLDSTINEMKMAMSQLKTFVAKLNEPGAIGKMVFDQAMLAKLSNTVNSLNILLDDFRVHPKRYTGGLVFGKKDKSPPLTKPLADSIPNPSQNP